MSRRLAATPLLLALVVSACGSAEDTPADSGPAAASSSPATSTPPQESSAPVPTEDATGRPPRTGTRIITAGSDYGPMLYDRGGQAIYLFDKERTAKPACYGECAAAWPPVLARGEPRGLRGARQSLLGTTERRDGTLQVTYDGHPLYFYAHEGKYQVLCHDIEEYGGRWLVVQPDGDPAP